MIHPTVRVLARLALLMLLLALPASAQADENATNQAQNSSSQDPDGGFAEKWEKMLATRPVLRAQGYGTGPAEIEDSGSDVWVAGMRTSLEWAMLRLEYNLMDFGWDDPASLPLGNGSDNPWDMLHRVSLNISYRDYVDENWYWFAGVGGHLSFEKEVDGAQGGSFRAGGGYDFGEGWKVGAGVALFGNEVRWDWNPFAFVSLPEDLFGFLDVELGWPTCSVGADLNDSTALRLAITRDSVFYRLADDSPVEKKGYVEIRSWKPGVYLDVKPVSGLLLTLGLEYNFEYQYEIFNQHGNHINTYNLANAFGGSLRLRYKF